VEEVEQGRVVHGGRGRRHGDAKGIGGKAVGEGGQGGGSKESKKKMSAGKVLGALADSKN
jgi:hypothetical protein